MPGEVVVGPDSAEANDNSVIRLSKSMMEELDLMRADSVLIKGKKNRVTLCIVLTIEDETIDNNVVIMNDVVRRNLRVVSGDVVTVEAKDDIPYCKKVQILPLDDTIENLNGNLFENFIKSYFLEAYRPLTLNDLFTIKGMNRVVEFKVVAMEPAMHGIISPNTEIDCQGDPIKREDEDSICELGYDDIGGYELQIDKIREIIEIPLMHPKLFKNLGIQPPNGILLHGLSGSGKTMLAKAIANETGAFFFYVNGPEIVSKMAGESESNLRKCFEEAEKHAPSIIFIDEIDCLIPNYKTNFDIGVHEQRVQSQLLVLLDGMVRKTNCIIIGATSRLHSINPSFRRFGRFDNEIELPFPNQDERHSILKIITKKMKLDSDINLKDIATSTDGYLGVDLSQLCSEAGMLSIREHINVNHLTAKKIEEIDIKNLQILTSTSHFKKAQEIVKPKITKEQYEKEKIGKNDNNINNNVNKNNSNEYIKSFICDVLPDLDSKELKEIATFTKGILGKRGHLEVEDVNENEDELYAD